MGTSIRRFLFGPTPSDHRKEQQEPHAVDATSKAVTRLSKTTGIWIDEGKNAPKASGEGRSLLDRPTPDMTPRRQALLEAMRLLHSRRQEVFVGLSPERRESLRMMAEFMLGLRQRGEDPLLSPAMAQPDASSNASSATSKPLIDGSANDPTHRSKEPISNATSATVTTGAKGAGEIITEKDPKRIVIRPAGHIKRRRDF